MSTAISALRELSASQAAKLFHLSLAEIDMLAKVHRILMDSIESVLRRLRSQLGHLPYGAKLLGLEASARGRRPRGMLRWLDAALQLWDADRREPRLKHLAIFCAKQRLPVSYIAAVMCCIQQACQKVLCEKATENHLEGQSLTSALDVLRKRLATEKVALLSIYSEHLAELEQTRSRQVRREVEARARRLDSTIALNQAINDEIEQPQIIRALAHHAYSVFEPDSLAVHLIQPGDLMETLLVLVDGRLQESPDKAEVCDLQRDWQRCRAARTGRPFHVSDVCDALIQCPYFCRKQEAGSYCCVPLAGGTQVMGWMHLRSARPNAFSPEDQEVLRIYGQMVGTALRSLRLMQENQRQATTDPLTGLCNRRRFQTLLDNEQRLLGRREDTVSIVMLDLDNFKVINDKLGHDAGDWALKAVAEALVKSVRETDEVARLGGDEFAVLLRGCGPANARKVAEGIIASVSRVRIRLDRNNHSLLSASAGVATCPEDGRTLDECVVMADTALLRAKAAGKNRVEMFDESIDCNAPAQETPAGVT